MERGGGPNPCRFSTITTTLTITQLFELNKPLHKRTSVRSYMALPPSLVFPTHKFITSSNATNQHQEYMSPRLVCNIKATHTCGNPMHKVHQSQMWTRTCYSATQPSRLWVLGSRSLIGSLGVWVPGPLTLKTSCIRQHERLLPSSTYNPNAMTTFRTSVKEITTKLMHFKAAVMSFLAVNASRCFPHWCSEDDQCCDCTISWVVFSGVALAIILQHQSKALITTVSPCSLSVITLWLKQPTCFCSAALHKL